MVREVLDRLGGSVRHVGKAARKRTLTVIAAVSLVLGLTAGLAVATTVYGTRQVEPLYRADHGHILVWLDNTKDEVRGRIHRHNSSHNYVSSPKNYLGLRVQFERAGELCAASNWYYNTQTVNYFTLKMNWPGPPNCPAGTWFGRARGAFYNPGEPGGYDRDNAKSPSQKMP